MKAVYGESRTYGLGGGSMILTLFLSTHFDGDELYAFPVFESDLAKSLSSSHPSQFLFNTRGLGLSSSIGLLQQNYASIEAFLEDDPEDSSHYEEVS